MAKRQRRQQTGVPPDGRAAERGVEHPAQREACDRDGDRLPWRERPHIGIDQIGVGLQIVEHDEQQEARDPGEIGLPLEPDQVLGQRLGCGEIFPHMVEAAAMHLPGLARDALAACSRPCGARSPAPRNRRRCRSRRCRRSCGAQRISRLAQSSERTGWAVSHQASASATKMTGSVQAIFESGSPTSWRTRKCRSAAPPTKTRPTSSQALGALVSMEK